MQGFRLAVITLLVAIAGRGLVQTVRADDGFQFNGDTRARYTGQTFPDESIFKPLAGSYAQDFDSITRLRFGYDRDRWDLRADYQFILRYGDTNEFIRQLPPGLLAIGCRYPDDRTRWFDLTDVIKDDRKTVLVQRLDRLNRIIEFFERFIENDRPAPK